MKTFKYIPLFLYLIAFFFFTACELDNSDDYIQKDKYITNMQSNTILHLNLKTGIPTDGETSQYSDGVYTLSQAPAHGTITLDGDILNYSPKANYIGYDEIKIEDGEEGYIGFRKITIEITVIKNTNNSDTDSSTASNLSILGNPSKTIIGGETYSFIPYVINDNSNKNIHFHITNKPFWISFDSGSGEMSGTAPKVDKNTLFKDIEITVGTDEHTHVSLPSFTIEVTP